MEAGPEVDEMEINLKESNKKIHKLCETISLYKLKLTDVNKKLECSDAKCDQLLEDNERLRNMEDALSKQVYYLKSYVN